MSRGLKFWKEAATLILAANSSAKTDAFKLLMLKRHRASKFMPNAFVFPGGISHEADFSPAWRAVFEQAGYGDLSALGASLGSPGPRPPMISRDHGSDFPPDLAFRICAIRETFEESGVLLARRVGEEGVGRQRALTSALSVTHAESHLSDWRSKVDSDAAAFSQMCLALGLVPDVWALREWSNWLTPTPEKQIRPSARRYDTLFYVCCLDHMPHVIHCERETSEAQWFYPAQALSSFHLQEIWLPPPQVYEVSKIGKFPGLTPLARYSFNRQNLGLGRLLPILRKTPDGLVELYLGDSMYPEDADEEGTRPQPSDTETSQQTMLELRRRSPNLHRFEMTGPYEVTVHCNITLPYGHIAPANAGSSEVLEGLPPSAKL